MLLIFQSLTATAHASADAREPFSIYFSETRIGTPRHTRPLTVHDGDTLEAIKANFLREASYPECVNVKIILSGILSGGIGIPKGPDYYTDFKKAYYGDAEPIAFLQIDSAMIDANPEPRLDPADYATATPAQRRLEYVRLNLDRKAIHASTAPIYETTIRAVKNEIGRMGVADYYNIPDTAPADVLALKAELDRLERRAELDEIERRMAACEY